MKEHISCNCKCKCKSTLWDSNQKWNPSTCVSENSKYLKSIADTSVTECDVIIIFMDNASTKKANTIATNVTSAALINCKSKRVEEIAVFGLQFY